MEQTTIQWTHDHLHLRCRDIEASARFYGDIFGGSVFRRPGRGASSLIEVGLAGLKLFLSPAAAEDGLETKCGGTSVGVFQLSFRVEDLDEAIREIKNKGAVFRKTAVVLPSGARAAFIDGPDGVEVELIQRPLTAEGKEG